LGITKHTAIGSDHRDTDATGGHLRHPIAQGRKVFRLSGGSGCPLGRARFGDARDGGEFLEAHAFILAAKSALGKKVHGEQNAHQQSEKREREFPE